MKTLLAIINHPKESFSFIQYVAEMATTFNAKVKLLYIQNPIRSPQGMTGPQGAAMAQIQKNMDGHAEETRKILAAHVDNVKKIVSNDVLIDFSTDVGLTTHIINKLVSSKEADMVVLESLEDESFWTQSSKNMEIVETVDCPVWIIPASYRYDPFKEIIYATDYKEEDVNGLRKLIKLTQNNSPIINALHITDTIDFDERVKEEGFFEMLRKKTAYEQLYVKVIQERSESDVAELLNDYAFLIKADLIVLLRTNRSFFERIFKPDPARKIIKKTNLPILIFHDKE